MDMRLTLRHTHLIRLCAGHADVGTVFTVLLSRTGEYI